MPAVVTVSENLFVWTLTLANGSARTVLGSSLDSVGSGVFPSPVVSAVRGAAYPGEAVPPIVATFAPTTVALGAANFTLSVNGSGFGPGAQIMWKGAPVPTTVVSPTQVTTPITMAGQVAMAVPVSVRTIAGQDSNVLTFPITATD